MITVTETAKDKLRALMGEEGKSVSDTYVRVGVSSGGCSGLTYKLDLDQEMTDQDKMIEDKEIKILVDKKSYLYLIGTTLNYSGGLNGKGFFFENPNASRTCGCGESFAV